jgi:hypothetical protein
MFERLSLTWSQVNLRPAMQVFSDGLGRTMTIYGERSRKNAP